LLALPLGLEAQDFNEVDKVVASDREGGDAFGSTVAVDGKYAIVGALGDDFQAGSAYIFERDGNGNWIEIQKLVSFSPSSSFFGYSVSLSGDYAIVGSMSAAYIFKRNENGFWEEVQYLLPSNSSSFNRFGTSVSLNGDYAIVGAPHDNEDTIGANSLNQSGSVYIFERNASDSWIEVEKLVAIDRAEDDKFGSSVSINGEYAIVGAIDKDESTSGGGIAVSAGSAYVFRRTGPSNWVEIQKLIAADQRDAFDNFGSSVSISGNYAVVGARSDKQDTGIRTGSAYVFELTQPDNWIEVQKIFPSDQMDNSSGFGLAVSIDGDRVIVGASEAFTGMSVSQESTGAAYLYERDENGNWTEVQKLVASDPAQAGFYGRAVSLNGRYAIVGAVGENEPGDVGGLLEYAGAAYIFENTANEAPIAVCQNITVEIDADGNPTTNGNPFMASDLDGGSTDDGTINGFSVDHPYCYR